MVKLYPSLSIRVLKIEESEKFVTFKIYIYNLVIIVVPKKKKKGDLGQQIVKQFSNLSYFSSKIPRYTAFCHYFSL